MSPNSSWNSSQWHLNLSTRVTMTFHFQPAPWRGTRRRGRPRMSGESRTRPRRHSWLSWISFICNKTVSFNSLWLTNVLLPVAADCLALGSSLALHVYSATVQYSIQYNELLELPWFNSILNLIKPARFHFIFNKYSHPQNSVKSQHFLVFQASSLRLTHSLPWAPPG